MLAMEHPLNRYKTGSHERVRDGFVALWAALGALWTMFAISGTARWIAAGKAAPVPIQGPDIYPFWQLMGMRALEASSVLFVVCGVIGWIVVPWRRERRFTLQGMMVVGGCLGFFIDPVINNFYYTFAWNQHAINFGTWASVFPAWTPQGSYGEGILWAFPQYIMVGAGEGSAGCWIVAKLRARLPGISIATAMLVVFLTFFVADFVIENTFLLFQVYAFARTHSGLTLFAGQLNQFPIYESIFVGAQAVPLTLLILSARDDSDGLSFVERGSARFSIRTRTLVRCFAVIGFTFVVYAAGYFIPWSWMSVTADSVIALPSYLQSNPM